MASSLSEYLFQQVTIIGVGLLGGSLGLVLKEEGLAKTVVGIGRRQVNLELALQVGAIDRFASEPHEAVRDSDLIVLATPVDTYVSHVQRWGQYVPSGAIVSDVGSVKGQLVFDVEAALPSNAYFVGAHPIAGKEKSGVAHATSKLFDGARCIVTPTARTNADALAKIRCLWEKAGSFAHACVAGFTRENPGGFKSIGFLWWRLARYDSDCGEFPRDVAGYLFSQS
jgi:prephenate dehydrogenase